MVGVSAQPKLKSLCVTQIQPRKQGTTSTKGCGVWKKAVQELLPRSFMIRIKVKRVLMKSTC